MNRDDRVWLLVSLVLLAGVVPAVAGGAEPDASIPSFEYTGGGQVDPATDDLLLWDAEPHEFTARLESNRTFDGEVCLVTVPSDSSDQRDLACKRATVPAESTRTVTIGISEWPAGLNGSQEASVLLREVNGSSVLDRTSLAVSVLGVDGDPDGDGLTNREEVSLGTGRENSDTDGDGLGDGDEVNVHGTDPTNPDTDDDGLDDGSEVEDHETNPLVADSDEDGLPDNLEISPYGTDPNGIDSDGDGLEDGAEVEQYHTEPDVADTDGDGLDDGDEVNVHGTEPTNPDSDGDGLDDGAEVNRHGTNPNEMDTDGDGQSDFAAVKDDDGRIPWEFLLLGGGAGGLLLLAGVAVLHRSGRLPTAPSRAGLDSLRETLDPRRGNTDGSDDESDDGSTGDRPAAEEVPPEFLSNEERVLGLLEENGGRMRQTEIVDETGWSKSKVSRVLSDMAADEQVVKVDVGKGNVVTRPEDVPTAAESPFDS